MKEYITISALIGLIGACNNNPNTEATDRIVIKALAFPILNPDADDETVRQIIDEIYAEKYAVSPGCAFCAMPCGNTSDYDINRIYNAEDDIRILKLTILSKLQEMAAYLYQTKEKESLPPEDMEFFYKALSYVSYDMKADALHTLLTESEELLQKTMK